MQVVFIYLLLPFVLNPHGLMVGLSLVLVSPMVSNDTNFAGFHSSNT